MTDTYAILDTYDYEVIKVIRETAATVVYQNPGDCERKSLSAFKWRGTLEDALLISQKLKSARAEKSRRQQEAANWFQKRVVELTTIAGAST